MAAPLRPGPMLLLRIAMLQVLQGQRQNLRGSEMVYKGQRHRVERRISPDPVLQGIFDMFNTIGPADAPGGLMARMHLDIEIEDIFKDGVPRLYHLLNSMNKSGTRQVASMSSWSWLRKDLSSASFNQPGWNGRISVLLNASKAWHLFAGMYPLDSDTNSGRAACENLHDDVYDNVGLEGLHQDGFDERFAMPGEKNYCMVKAAHIVAQSNSDNAPSHAPAQVWQPMAEQRTSTLPSACAESDRKCRMLQAGGGLHQHHLQSLESCRDPKDPMFSSFRSCFTFQKDSNGENKYNVHYSDGCAACTSPYLCVMEDPPSHLSKQASLDAVYDPASGEFRAYIGKNSSRWWNMFAPFATGSKTQGITGMFRQCMFRNEDVEAFIHASHELYRNELDTEAEDYQNFANPHNWVFFENEIVMYVPPNPSLPEYAQMERDLLDSVVAILVDNRTCEEQVAPWGSVPTFFSKVVDGKLKNYSYENARDRCHGPDGYVPLGGLGPEGPLIESAMTHARALQDIYSKSLKRTVPLLYSRLPIASGVDKDLFAQALKAEVDPIGWFEQVKREPIAVKQPLQQNGVL